MVGELLFRVGEAANHSRVEILQWLLGQGYELRGRGDEVEKAVKAEMVTCLLNNVPSTMRIHSGVNLSVLTATMTTWS